MSLLILDIDHFKKVNDTYGHDVGDFVLQECVRIMKTIFFKEDEMVARVGGEEFVVVLPSHSIEQAVARAEALQAIVRNEVFVHGDQSIRFTVSMGIAQMLEGEKITDLLKRADTALYNSKNNGRNKYSLAGQTLKTSKAA